MYAWHFHMTEMMILIIPSEWLEGSQVSFGLDNVRRATCRYPAFLVPAERSECFRSVSILWDPPRIDLAECWKVRLLAFDCELFGF